MGCLDVHYRFPPLYFTSIVLQSPVILQLIELVVQGFLVLSGLALSGLQAGFVQVLENLESPRILFLIFS